MFAGGKMRGEAEFLNLGAGLSPYPYALIVEQGKHESLIYDHIRSQGRDVRWQCEMTSFSQIADSVTVEIRNAAGEPETINARYLVGCDGAKSPVRHALGMTFEGSTFERMFYVADVQIDWQYSHDALQVFLMRNSLLAFFPMKGENQYRIVGTFPQEFEKDEGEVLYEEIEERIKLDAEIDLDITHVNWFSTYKVHTRHVNKFIEGRCFVAGDSAHIHTPAGAQGMNTGIQDGYNLAWKLNMMLRGKANEGLLATYNHERLENAANLTASTDRFFNLVASPSPLLVFVRLYIFPYVAQLLFSLDVVKKFIFPRVSQIAINYRSSPLSETDGRFKVKGGDRMPWFEIEASSVYDRLREPVFHLILFTDGKTALPPLPEGLMDEWRGRMDSTVITLTPRIADIFGSSRSFFVILRPDNYIGIISDDLSVDSVRRYLGKFTFSKPFFA